MMSQWIVRLAATADSRLQSQTFNSDTETIRLRNYKINVAARWFSHYHSQKLSAIDAL